MLYFAFQQRKWEKGLQQIFGESNADKLVTTAKEELKNYFSALPKPSMIVFLSVLFFISKQSNFKQTNKNEEKK